MSLKEKLITASPDFLVKWIAAPYVAGDSTEAALEMADVQWKERQICSSLNILGEDVTNEEEVKFYLNAYFDVLDKIGNSENTSISLKPTQFGTLEDTDYIYSNIEKIIQRAAKYNNFIRIEMEDHNYTDITLSLYKKLGKQYNNVGTVLQSRLFRTEKDIDNLNGFRANVRLCIGIYLEPPEIALQKKPEMKEKLLIYAKKLFDKGHFVAFATHDEKLIHKALDLVEKNNVPNDQFEFQMLMGVPKRKIQDYLVQKSFKFRLYIPYCLNWKHAIAYCQRRLNANPNLGFYVATNFFKKLLGKR